MPNAGEILTHAEMCVAEGMMLQRGMVFRQPPLHGIILMSQRPNAPYVDSVDELGNIIYEGHDAPRTLGTIPKLVDQPKFTSGGGLTENGKFASWTERYDRKEVVPARFHVYEKLIKGMWSFRGSFLLRRYYMELVDGRFVFKFILDPISEAPDGGQDREPEPPPLHELQTRQIPTHVKQEVFKRDKGQYVICGEKTHLHFDHDLPYSKGGASATVGNVRLLCARHNLSKGARIE